MTRRVRVLLVGGCVVCGLIMLGCSEKPEARLAVYGLADRYVTLRGEGASTLLALGEDGSFLLSGVVRPAYGKISPGAELARGTWVPTARGLALQSEEWEAVLVADTSQVFARDRAETIASLVWVRSTSPSPVDSMTLVSWPELSELLYPRGGSGKRHATWQVSEAGTGDHVVTGGELTRAVDAMRGFDRPWFVAGGWALDLFLGAVSRDHADLEIALFREDQRALRRQLASWEFEKVAGGRRVPWSVDEWLMPPVHEVHASAGTGSSGELEFLLNEREGDQWVYRRNAAVTCPANEIGLRSSGGVPFLRPEIVLLYKAKAPRPVDEQDFDAVCRGLEAASRAWLRAALELCHPGHHWLDRLRAVEA